MKKRSVIGTLFVFMTLAVVSCAPATGVPEQPTDLPTSTPAPVVSTEEPTEEPISQPEEETSAGMDGRVNFKQLGISLEIPESMVVIKDPIVNLNDPTKLQSYTFFIQNYGPQEGPGEDYFQIYGIVQYDLPEISWDEYKSGILDSDMYEYAREIEINGLPGLDTQIAGQRNRFVYHFMLDGQVLSMAVADPTEENKALADEIVNTLQFSPGNVTDASGVGLLKDPNGYYQMYLPDTWVFSFEPTAGIRVSDLQASSPYAEIVVVESEGTHDKIYFENGVTLNVVVLEDDSAKNEPIMAQIQSSNPFMIAGIEGMDYTFLETSTAKGEIRELRYYYNGLSYLVRFSYAENADLSEIDWLARNFQITP